MPVPLRVVIGGVTATVVLVVAVVTLTITYTVSVAAVHDAGERLSAAIADAVDTKLGAFFQQQTDALLSWVNVTALDDFKRPVDMPDFDNGALWAKGYLATAHNQLMASKLSFSVVSLQFADSAQVVAQEHPAAPGWISLVVKSWRGRNATYRGAADIEGFLYDAQTKRRWDTAVDGPQPRLIAANDITSNYAQISLLTGQKPGCTFVSPSIDTNGGTTRPPTYVMYGICTVFNQSGVSIAHVAIGRYMYTLVDFLKGSTATANMALFLVDSQQLMLAASTGVDPIQYYDPVGFTMRSECVSSSLTSVGREVIGCRTPLSQYPYAPLQDAFAKDPAFLTGDGHKQKFTKLDGEKYFLISYRVTVAIRGYTMNLLLFMPEKDVLGNIVAGRNIAIAVTVCVALVAIVLVSVLVAVLLAPIDEIARRMYFTSQLTSEAELRAASAEGRGLLRDADRSSNADGGADGTHFDAVFDQPPEDDLLVHRSSMAEIRALQTAYTTMDTAIKSFTKYVPRDVVRELMATNQICELQMRPMRCSMLFTDIAGFTSICERVPPHILSGLIRLYFERCSRIVMAHGGVIDKFIGDCIMAVWGAPVPIDRSEIRSAVCGRMLVEETQSAPLATEFLKANEPLAIRVGVSTGEVLAGNMGSKVRMNYTVIGDDVNLASRLEGLNKQWGTTVMVSEDTAEECADYLHMRYVISIAVVGKHEPVKVYEILGVNPDCKSEALGKITSEASEQQTVNDVQRSAMAEEMMERYAQGLDFTVTTAPIATAGKLLRRCLRKCPVNPAEVEFARAYEEALAAWNSGRFAEVVTQLQAVDHDPVLPTGCGERLSVRNLLRRAEECVKQPPSGVWTGVWVATEK